VLLSTKILEQTNHILAQAVRYWLMQLASTSNSEEPRGRKAAGSSRWGSPGPWDHCQQQSQPTCVGYALTHALLLLQAVLRALGSGIWGIFVQAPLLSKRQPW